MLPINKRVLPINKQAADGRVIFKRIPPDPNVLAHLQHPLLNFLFPTSPAAPEQENG